MPTPAGEEKGEEEEETPTELAIGELDRPFTYVTLGVVLAIAAAVLFAVWTIVLRIELPAQSSTAAGEFTDGRLSVRLAGLVYLGSLTAGVVLLLLGTWMAALEVRGRLRAPRKPAKKPAGPSVTQKEPLAGLDAKTAEALLKQLRRMRGTIAVLVCGGILVLVSVWGVTSLAQEDVPAPVPSPSST